MTALRRLLKHPHSAVFDTSPGAQLAFRLRHQQGVSWSVADEVLTATVGDVVHLYRLDTMTVAQLVTRLRADGFEVSDFSPAFAGLTASVLVEGRNSQGSSNGDHLNGFTSLLWALFGSYARELRAAKAQIPEALRQMVITQAEGEWLDLWGLLYGQKRKPGQDDADYAPAIPREAFRIRLNARAIEKAILENTGKDVRIEEPWSVIFRLDESALSGDHAFYDGQHVGYHLIRPVSTVAIDWTDVLEVIRRNIAAGVEILPPETRYGISVNEPLDGTVWAGGSHLSGIYARSNFENHLDYLVLSAETLTLNYDLAQTVLLSLDNRTGRKWDKNVWGATSWDARDQVDALLDPQSISTHSTVAQASIALSDGPQLGTENAIFPRAELLASSRQLTLSDDGELSDIDLKPAYRPVDRVIVSTFGFMVDVSAPEAQGHAQLVERYEYGSAEPVDGTTGIIGVTSLSSKRVAANSPVAVSMQRYGTPGVEYLRSPTWTEAATTWGNTTWASRTYLDDVDAVSVSGPVTYQLGVYDADTIEVGP